jgi:RIO kinase 2
MSEYNVFVEPDGVTLFDRPQAVGIDHPNADELLQRDVRNLVGYFQRKHPGQVGEVDVESVARAIADGSFRSVTGTE